MDTMLIMSIVAAILYLCFTIVQNWYDDSNIRVQNSLKKQTDQDIFIKNFPRNVLKAYNLTKSNVFSRCKFCNGLKIRGICQSCGSASKCSVCGMVMQPDGTARKMSYLDSGRTSHTYCKPCLTKVEM